MPSSDTRPTTKPTAATRVRSTWWRRPLGATGPLHEARVVLGQAALDLGEDPFLVLRQRHPALPLCVAPTVEYTTGFRRRGPSG